MRHFRFWPFLVLRQKEFGHQSSSSSRAGAGLVKGTLGDTGDFTYSGISRFEPQDHGAKRNLISSQIFFASLSGALCSQRFLQTHWKCPWKCQCLLMPWSISHLSCSLSSSSNTKPEGPGPFYIYSFQVEAVKKGQWINICCLAFNKTKAMSIQ